MNTFRRVRRPAVGAAVIATAAAAALGLSSRVALATDITVVEHASSLEIQYMSSGTGGTTFKVSQAQPATGMRIGFQTSFVTTSTPTNVSGYPATNGGIEALMFFQLPAIPAGQQLSGVSFTFSELKEGSTGQKPYFNVDLYAVGYDKNATPFNESPPLGSGGVASSTVAPNYYYLPDANTDAQGGPLKVTDGTAVGTDAGPMTVTKIQDDILVPDDWDAANASANHQVVHTTSAAGNSNLLSFIQGLYANPNFAPGNYLTLRMNPDQKAVSPAPDGTNTHRYQIPFNTSPDATAGAPDNAVDTVFPQLTLTFSPASIAGDVNGDGVVDLGDINYITARWLNAGSDGDANGDGTIDLGDVNFVTAHWLNASAPAGIAAVPEPASLSLLGLGAAGLLARRRRSR